MKEQELIKKRYKIFEWLHLALEVNEVKMIRDLTSTDSRDFFIEQVKVFIVADLGRFYGFYIELTNDFVGVTKKELM